MMKVSLKVISGPHTGREFSFEEHDTFIVGRASYAHFRLSQKDRYFSRAHFLIEVNPPFCRLMDMASTNGTIVNKEKVIDVDLKDGDLIKGGDTVIRVIIENSAEIAQTNQAVSEHDWKAARPRSEPADDPAFSLRHTVVGFVRVSCPGAILHSLPLNITKSLPLCLGSMALPSTIPFIGPRAPRTNEAEKGS